jgi:uncharacterized caspase-like protein
VDGTRSALIIASDNYADADLSRLRAPASDARALADVLKAPGIGGFKVRILHNQLVYRVNVAVEDFFADRQPDDLLLMHFSCHGVKDDDGELYFAMTNTRPNRLGSTAVTSWFVNRCMNRSRSRRIVLLLDCCYAGAFERSMHARGGKEMPINERLGGNGRAVITASSAMEYAFENGELTDVGDHEPSVFTGALVRGLQTGDADKDQDGMVDLDELYNYVYNEVRAATSKQTPRMWATDLQGQLLIARRARPVTEPAPLPSSLQGLLKDSRASVRTAAVEELANLLRGKHAGQVLAARLALEQLAAEDDSLRVRAAATVALSEAPAKQDGSQAPQDHSVPAAPKPPSATEPANAAGSGDSRQEPKPEETHGNARSGRRGAFDATYRLAGLRAATTKIPEPPNPGDGAIDRLADQRSKLRDVLDAVNDEPRLMDTSLDNVHNLTRQIVRDVKIFDLHKSPDKFGREIYSAFEDAHSSEYEAYELYENDLERYQQRQTTDLDSVIKRRGAYLSALRAFETRSVDILEYVLRRRPIGP